MGQSIYRIIFSSTSTIAWDTMYQAFEGSCCQSIFHCCVLMKRIQLICNLEDYVNDTVQYTSRGRLGEILCLIPTLKSISNELIELIQFTKLFGFADVDALIQEMLLNRDDNDSMNVFQDITDTSRMTQESMAPQITEVNYMDSGRQGNKHLFNARVPQVKHLSDLGMVT